MWGIVVCCMWCDVLLCDVLLGDVSLCDVLLCYVLLSDVMCMCCYVVTNAVYGCVMYCCVMYNYVLYGYVLYCYCITLHPQLGSFASQLPLIIYKTHTMWGPKTIAKLVNTTPITMVYDTHIAIVNGAYKPTYKYGADCICTNNIYIYMYGCMDVCM